MNYWNQWLDGALREFQYPLCRIDGVNRQRHYLSGSVNLFQYPLCRIDGVNNDDGSVSKSKVYVSVSALSDRWCELGRCRRIGVTCVFQYPLCRIDGVNSVTSQHLLRHLTFQYPLCRIDGVNRIPDFIKNFHAPGFSIRSVGSMV